MNFLDMFSKKYSNTRLNENTFSWNRVPCGQEDGRRDGQTDVAKLIAAFRNSANAPNEAVLSFVVQVHWDCRLTPYTLHSNPPQYGR
jgi:hypothetical protein